MLRCYDQYRRLDWWWTLNRFTQGQETVRCWTGTILFFPSSYMSLLPSKPRRSSSPPRCNLSGARKQLKSNIYKLKIILILNLKQEKVIYILSEVNTRMLSQRLKLFKMLQSIFKISTKMFPSLQLPLSKFSIIQNKLIISSFHQKYSTVESWRDICTPIFTG